MAGRYIAAVGSRDYASAFFRMLADPLHAHVTMTPRETLAMREVADAYRAMNIGTPGQGGYQVPLEVDPTIRDMAGHPRVAVARRG